MKAAPFIIPALALLACGCTETELLSDSDGSETILYELAGFTAMPSAATDNNSVAAPPKPTEFEAEGAADIPTVYLHSQERVNDGRLNPRFASAGLETGPSRSTPVRDHEIFASLYGEFTLEGWCKNRLYIPSQQIEAHSENIWRPEQTHYWPATDPVDFYAYSPSSALNNKIHIDDSAKEMSFDHKTPATAQEQTDLLVATTSCSKIETTDGHAPLDFMHPLSAVTFKAKEVLPGLVIERITLSGLASQGHCTVSHADTKPTIAWTNLKETSSFSQDFNIKIPDSSSHEITGRDISKTFMVIPQKLEGATVTVECTTADNEKLTLAAPLKSSNFSEYLPGKEYVYCISTYSINWEYHLEATPQVTLNDGAVLGKYTVKSYRKNLVTDEIVPLKWTAQFDDSTRVHNYVPGYTFSDCVASKEYDLKCAPQHLWTSTYPGDQQLREAPWNCGSKGNNDPKDLSIIKLDGMDQAKRTTANCYLVHGPGIYAIPVVYGNAIYKGQDNKQAYKLPYTAGVDEMQYHRRLENKNITQPWVDEDYSMGDPKEVWEDAPGLVRNVRLTKMRTDDIDGKEHAFIVFEVPRTNIVQGNAIVAARNDKGQIVWSWHIWVTDYDHFVDPLVNIQSMKYPDRHYRFFKHKLGECARKTLTYMKRESICTYVQAESGKTAQTTITQNEFILQTYVPNGTYYQWGRKDPIIGIAQHEANSVKPYFIDDVRQYSVLTTPQQGGPSDDHILYPEKMLAGSSPKGTGKPNDFYNAWDNRAKNGTVSIKTVYDPSPAGYKLAPNYVFEVFLKGVNQFNKDLQLEAATPNSMKYPEDDKPLTSADLTLELYNKYLNGYHEYNFSNPEDDKNYTFTLYPEAGKKGIPFDVYATGQRWSTGGHSVFKVTELMNPNYVYIWVSTPKDNDIYTSTCFALGFNPYKELSIWVGKSQYGRHSMARPVYYIKNETEEEQKQ